MFSFPNYKEAVITDSITTFLTLHKICGCPNTCSLQVNIHKLFCRTIGRTRVKTVWNTSNTSNPFASKGGNATYFSDPLLLSCFQPWEGHLASANLDHFFIDIIGLVSLCFCHCQEKHGIFTKHKPSPMKTL